MLQRDQNTSTQGERAVLFDFDGTMGRSLGTWTEAYRGALREHGVDLLESEVITCCFHTSQAEVVKTHSIADANKFRDTIWHNVNLNMHTVDPYPNLLETLTDLRESGYKTAIVTNSRRATVEPVLHRWKIFDLFHAFVTVDDVSYGKPDPEMLHRAINQINVSPAQTYIVGDSTVDIEAGRRAGVKTIAFSPSENWRYLALESLRQTNPSHLVHSYSDLRNVLGLDPKGSKA